MNCLITSLAQLPQLLGMAPEMSEHHELRLCSPLREMRTQQNKQWSPCLRSQASQHWSWCCRIHETGHALWCLAAPAILQEHPHMPVSLKSLLAREILLTSLLSFVWVLKLAYWRHFSISSRSFLSLSRHHKPLQQLSSSPRAMVVVGEVLMQTVLNGRSFSFARMVFLICLSTALTTSSFFLVLPVQCFDMLLSSTVHAVHAVLYATICSNRMCMLLQKQNQLCSAPSTECKQQLQASPDRGSHGKKSSWCISMARTVQTVTFLCSSGAIQDYGLSGHKMQRAQWEECQGIGIATFKAQCRSSKRGFTVVVKE